MGPALIALHGLAQLVVTLGQPPSDFACNGIAYGPFALLAHSSWQKLTLILVNIFVFPFFLFWPVQLLLLPPDLPPVLQQIYRMQ